MKPYRFGPLITDEGVVYRLWAPAARTVDLILEGGQAREMRREDGGWFISASLNHREGTRYRFRVNGSQEVPDPASRLQESDVHGFSLLTGPRRVDTPASEWRGRPWHESVIYEMHVGTFTTEGTFAAAAGRLEHLAQTGISMIELMPIADFRGQRNWGYDGVLPFAPDRAYGSLEELHGFIARAHATGIAVVLDVVYNHFGPEGNYLGLYAPGFFTDTVSTPWGAAIDFSRPEVRTFFVENARYWVKDVGFDGLRIDAVHAIHDGGTLHIAEEIAAAVRPAHVILENEKNEARYLGDGRCTAQWNDDIHHLFHVSATGERFGYYAPYTHETEPLIKRSLATGFAFQGDGRGEPSAHLSPTAFVSFLQNHDQIGNRAFGDRLSTLCDTRKRDGLQAALLLAPQIPLLFMGEEWGSTTPFCYFCDYDGELADAVRDGRRREFSLDDLPDPVAVRTFTESRINWNDLSTPEHRSVWETTCLLLELRREHLMPFLGAMRSGIASGGSEEAIEVRWPVGGTEERSSGDVSAWIMCFNLGDRERPQPAPIQSEDGAGDGVARRLVFATPTGGSGVIMPPWSVAVYKEHLS